jgi:hypothetical protein
MARSIGFHLRRFIRRVCDEMFSYAAFRNTFLNFQRKKIRVGARARACNSRTSQTSAYASTHTYNTHTHMLTTLRIGSCVNTFLQQFFSGWAECFLQIVDANSNKIRAASGRCARLTGSDRKSFVDNYCRTPLRWPNTKWYPIAIRHLIIYHVPGEAQMGLLLFCEIKFDR